MSEARLVASRLAFAAVSVTAALYALVTLVPFTYREIVQAELLPPVTAFARLHPYLNLAVSAPLILAMRREARGLCAALTLVAVALLVRPVLAGLQGGVPSVLAAGGALAPLIWLAIVDLRAGLSRGYWRTSTDERRAFVACLAASTAALIGFGAAALTRQLGDAPAASELAAGLVWSTALHMLTGLGAFVVLATVTALARGAAQPAKAELALGAGVLALGGWLFLTRVAFPSVAFTGPSASLAAAALAGASASALAGLAARMRAPGAGGLETLVSPLSPVAGQGATARLAWGATLAFLASGLAAAAATLDWDFVVQRFVAATAWIALLAAFLGRRLAPGATPGGGAAYRLLGVAIIGLVAQRGLEASRQAWPALVRDPEFRVGRALDRWAGLDPSFRLLRDGFGRGAGREGAAFFEMLSRNTNLSRSVNVAPVEVGIGEPAGALADRRPHLFVLVIDSLRRDYLSPYNADVTFTPEIDSFAERSVVMRQAFTPYGGTGLSEPSLWAGARLLHKQYVTPFAPMNVLEKLVRREAYEAFVSVDTILEAILDPEWPLEHLDRRVLNRDYDLCSTLEELQEKLDRRPSAGDPVFVYSQPQNLHVAQIASQGRSVLRNDPYPGFDPPYASRLARLDACFGAFVKRLEESGMLADSVVVLTADHGDSLGEQGRWGHAYTLFPEVVRVPLVIHLPGWLRDRARWDADTPTFLIDIAPSLGALLGYPAPSPGGLSGRSVFGLDGERPPPAADEHLLASSYGPVYGLLWAGGRRLYVADGVNYVESYYELDTSDAFVERPASPELQAGARRRIAERIERIAAFYAFRP